MVGFWGSKDLAADPSIDYQFCGLRVGPRQVLTVSHGLEREGRLWARLMGDATQPYEAEVARPEDIHPEFDAVLLTLRMAPPGAAWQGWAIESRQPNSVELHGVFEGAQYRRSVTLQRPNTAESHHLFVPEQPLGVSGGALVSDGLLWGMAVRRYANERMGCALPFYLLRDWLCERLAQHGVPATALPPPVLPPRLASLQRWLDDARCATLKAQLEDSARDAADAGAAPNGHPLQQLASHQPPHDPLAGIHLLGRALARTRKTIGEDDYRRYIAQRVTDLFCCVVAPAFDECCVEPPPPPDGEVPMSRLTPFEDLNLSAVLAARLFGGSLDFKPKVGGGWRPEWVFPIHAPPNGEKAEQAFFREAYRRMVQSDSPEQVRASRESRALDETEMAALRFAIHARMIQHETLLVFIDADAVARVSPSISSRAERFARATRANVLVLSPPDDARPPPLRISAHDFQTALNGILDMYLPAPAATQSHSS